MSQARNPSPEAGGEWGESQSSILPDGWWLFDVTPSKVYKSKNQNMTIEGTLTVVGTNHAGDAIKLFLVGKPEEPDNFNNKKRMWFQESCGVEFKLDDDLRVIGPLLKNKQIVGRTKTNLNDRNYEQTNLTGVHPADWRPDSGEWGDGTPCSGSVEGSNDVAMDMDYDLEEDGEFLID